MKVNFFTGNFTAGYPGDLSNAELYALLLSTTSWNLVRYNQSNPIKLNFSRTQSVRGKLWKEAEGFFFSLDPPTTPHAPIIYPGITVYNLLFKQNTINNWFRNSWFFVKPVLKIYKKSLVTRVYRSCRNSGKMLWVVSFKCVAKTSTSASLTSSWANFSRFQENSRKKEMLVMRVQTIAGQLGHLQRELVAFLWPVNAFTNHATT